MSRSSTEAEYYAITTTTNGICWHQYLLWDFGIVSSEYTLRFYDNTPAIQLESNPTFYERKKYIEIDDYFI